MNRSLRLLVLGLFLISSPAMAGRELTFSTIKEAHFKPPVVEVMREAYRRLGFTITLAQMSTQRSLMEAGQGVYDGELFRARGIEAIHPDLIMVDIPCYELDVHIYLPAQKAFPVKGWESIPPGYTIVVPFGVKYIERAIETHRLTAFFVKTPEDALGFLLSEKADFTLSTTDLDQHLSARGLDRDLTRLDPPVARVPVFHYLHKKNKDLVPGVRAVLKQMHDDGTIAAILPPWKKAP